MNYEHIMLILQIENQYLTKTQPFFTCWFVATEPYCPCSALSLGSGTTTPRRSNKLILHSQIYYHLLQFHYNNITKLLQITISLVPGADWST